MASTAAELLSLALHSDEGETPADAAGERILDAALAAAAAAGLERITMDEVAERAKVGRMTVYRRFGGRQQLVRALELREIRRALADIAAAIDPAAPVADQVADGFVATLRVAGRHPLSARLFRYEPAEVLAALNDPADPLLDLLRAFGAQQIRAGGASGDDPEMAAEILVRIGLSFLLVPRSIIDVSDEAVARDLARTLIAPIVMGSDPTDR